MSDIETHKYWLETILTEASDSLNDWESNFIDSLKIRLDHNRELSPRQAEILERIYAEKTK